MGDMIEPMHPHGLRLLKQWERGPTDGSVPLSPGGAALKPYRCDGDKVTIGWGCTEWFDGTPVLFVHELRDEIDAEVLLEHNVRKFVALVDRLVTREITPFQRAGLACLAFNIGPANFKTSSALRLTNEGRFEDASEAFGLWTGAANGAPNKQQRREAARYGEKLGRGKDGILCWIGPDGEPCAYMHRYTGLLSRHLSEACLYNGLDWVEATGGRRVWLNARPPSEAEWNAKKRRWEEQTLDQTRYRNIARIAEAFPLSEPEDDFMFEGNVAIPSGMIEHEDPALPDAWAEERAMPPVSEPVREPPELAPQAPPAAPDARFQAPAGPVAGTAAAPVGTKPLSPNTIPVESVPYGLDPKAGTKPIEESERGQGFWYQQLGSMVIRIGAVGGLGTAFQGASKAVLGDPVLFTLVIGTVTAAGIAVTGFVVKAFGDWRRKNGERDAVQALR